MSEFITIARPYAKAAFEHALNTQSLDVWSDALKAVTMAYDDTTLQAFLDNPSVLHQQKAEVFDDLIRQLSLGKELEAFSNFIVLLAENNRLEIIPEIFVNFSRLKSEQEKTLEVVIRTFSSLSREQHDSLQSSLENRLGRKIKIQEEIDKELLGGAIIQAGDMVIDGSVKGKLEKLSSDLAA
jgi:F-type H+-transporting ATPase subunit delta